MSFSVCHGSTDEACVVVCGDPGVCFTKSTNSPAELKVPAEISEMAYPTQFRMS
jgi:hypothetical protein